jgi:hypothetical protein
MMVTSRRGFMGAAAAAGAGAAAVGAAVPAEAGAAPAGAPSAHGGGGGRGESVVRGAYVLTMDAALGDLPDGEVHVRDGRIVAAGSRRSTRNASPARPPPR